MNIDLHSHSNASDGALSPEALVRRAADRGVDVLALTDHDQLAGLAEARAAARTLPLELIDGVEISVTWRGLTLHVLGLRIDAGNAELGEGPADLGCRLATGSRGARAIRAPPHGPAAPPR